MKIIFKKVESEINYDGVNRTEYIGNYFSIGDEFKVYGLRYRNNRLHFYNFDGHHLVLVNSLFVDLINAKVPNNWILKVWGDGGIILWPELFYEEDFLENFSDWEQNERSRFEELRNNMND